MFTVRHCSDVKFNMHILKSNQIKIKSFKTLIHALSTNKTFAAANLN